MLQIGVEEVEQRLVFGLPEPERVASTIGIANGGQWHEEDAIGEVIDEIFRHREGQARFADASRARERQQAHIGTPEQVPRSIHVLLTPKEGSGRRWQVVSGCLLFTRERNDVSLLHS